MPQKRSAGSLEKDFRTTWFDELPIGVVILDRDGKFAYVNDTFEQLLGRPRRKILGTPPDMYVPPSDSARLIRDILQLFRGVQIEKMVYEFLRPNGSTKKIAFVSTPIYGPKRKTGKAVKYILIVQVELP